MLDAIFLLEFAGPEKSNSSRETIDIYVWLTI